MNPLVKNTLKNIRDFGLKIFNIFPIQNAIIFESNPDFNDEGYWMCKKFFDEGMNTKYKIYWCLKEHDLKYKPKEWDIKCIFEKPRNIVEWFQKHYVLHTARCILDSCNFVPKTRENQFRMFLNHAAMPIKNCDQYFHRIGNYDFFSAGTEYTKNYCKSIGLPEEKSVVMGMARFDRLKNKNHYLRELCHISNDSQVVIWMPTYRQHESLNKSGNIPLVPANEYGETGLPVLKTKKDIIEINEKLRKLNEVLVIKPHQSQNLSFLEVEELSNIRIITNQILREKKIQLYDFLSETDALITDYSSIYIDYLLLQRPIGLTIDDIEIYEKNFGFTMKNYKEYIKGFYIEKKSDFHEFLLNVKEVKGFMEETLVQAYERYHSIRDFSCTDQLYNFIIEKANLSR